ncbi:hypothetical protein B566_EDAN016895 [Ephemera danica]|nr:hypothetical protein B566_EDAN016895 [Ephemera danica]
MLYELLAKLQQRAFYIDTDSVCYLQRPGEDVLPLGEELGALSNELKSYGGEDTHIDEICVAAANNNAMKIVDADKNLLAIMMILYEGDVNELEPGLFRQPAGGLCCSTQLAFNDDHLADYKTQLIEYTSCSSNLTSSPISPFLLRLHYLLLALWSESALARYQMPTQCTVVKVQPPSYGTSLPGLQHATGQTHHGTNKTRSGDWTINWTVAAAEIHI